MPSFGVGLQSNELSDLNNSTNISGIMDMLGFDLIRDNMMKQIHNQTESTIDYLNILKSRFNKVIEEEAIDSEDRSEIKYEMIDFCEELIQVMSREFDVMGNIISDDYLSMLNTVEVWYNFLVLNRCQMVEKFLIQYIEQNKSALTSGIDVDDKIKDISSLSYKKKNFTKEDIFVMAHIPEIIDFIKNGNIIESDEFLATINDGDYYTSKMVEMFETGATYGNFVPRMLYTVLGEEYDCNEATRIRNSIRAFFYKKNVNNVTAESEED